MNIKLTLSFDGTDFHGWQYQPDRRTVSGELMNVLGKLIEGSYKLIGVGRTDAGVHALNYVANVKVRGRLRVPLKDLKNKLNTILPEDIHVKGVEIVDEDFHARYSARFKIYRYLFSSEYDPLMRRRAWYTPTPPEPERLNEEFKVLLGTHDFSPFAADERENTLCTLYDITFGYLGKFIFMDVKGDRFLRKMVRFLASLAVMLTQRRISAEDVKRSLRSGERIKKLTPAPPWGLYLLEVEY